MNINDKIKTEAETAINPNSPKIGDVKDLNQSSANSDLNEPSLDYLLALTKLFFSPKL